MGAHDNIPRVYKPTWVANIFLMRGSETGQRIDPLKIQKLVYCFHGWHLAITGSPAVGERFEAWPHGPVLSSLYHTFKHYKFTAITQLASDVDPRTGKTVASYVSDPHSQFDDIFSLVWERYGGLSGTQLSAMTHADGTPWSKARSTGLQYIPDRDIREHFVQLARQVQA